MRARLGGVRGARLLFWQEMLEPYASKIPGSRVVAFGGSDFCGSVRPVFLAHQPPPKYVGVHWCPGPGVDVVSVAHAFPVRLGPFEFVVSESMLEHDQHWQSSLKRMSDVLASDGVMVLSWGGAGGASCTREPPVGVLPARRVITYLKSLGLYVHRFHYEEEFHPESTPGEVGLVATWTGAAARGDRHISPLDPSDEA